MNKFLLIIVLFSSLNLTGKGVERNKLRLASYNINFGNVNLRETAMLIRSLKADFVALQETNPRSKKFLMKALKQDYPYMKFVHDKRKPAGGFAFLSNLPFAGLKYHKRKHGLFGAFSCRLNFKDEEIDILSVHLTPLIPKRNMNIAEAMTSFRKTQKLHLKEMKTLVQLKALQPKVVLGDFNSLSSQLAGKYLKSLTFKDSFLENHDALDKSITWRWNYNGIKLRYRIDHIFTSEHFKSIECKIYRKGPSDHYPIVSDLKLLGI